ncbi:MAG: hypothetical protein ACRD3O_11590 [Terriglobia bacterium]
MTLRKPVTRTAALADFDRVSTDMAGRFFHIFSFSAADAAADLSSQRITRRLEAVSTPETGGDSSAQIQIDKEGERQSEYRAGKAISHEGMECSVTTSL